MARGNLSKRGTKLAEDAPMPGYLREHFARAEDPAYIGLCVAENKLMFDLLSPRLAGLPTPPDHVLGYDAMIGNQDFRETLAGFMAQRFLGRRFDPSQIAVLAGAGTVLEDVFYALADPGDAVLVPTPSYAGFWMDLETRNGLHIVPVHTSSDDRFRLTTDLLDAAIERSAHPVKALLFTNPDNPLGRVATPEDIQQILAWVEARGIHVVFDEIYALSVFGDTPFASVASLVPSLGDHAHVIWAFSKDFGASGLRCGLVVSENEALIQAVDGLAYWGAVSGHTQWALARMLADADWVEEYGRTLSQRLGDAYGQVTAALTAAGIPFVPAEAGIFVVCDLRQFLSAPTFEAEHRLWQKILDEARVNLTPGAACRIHEPGFFRLCYAGQPLARVIEAVERMRSPLAS